MLIWKVPEDGSSLFHALLLGYNQSYRLESQQGRPISRKALVAKLRHELSLLLGSPVDPLERTSPRYYDISKSSLSLDVMTQAIANPDHSLDQSYIPFISEALVKDIFIVDLNAKKLLFAESHNRPTLVLATSGGMHYDLVGLHHPQKDVIQTLFPPDDPFLTSLREYKP
jgi:hypothetical protein